LEFAWAIFERLDRNGYPVPLRPGLARSRGCESPDPAKESIPTVIELNDNAAIIDMARGFLLGANK
jgi:hypothetical protein